MAAGLVIRVPLAERAYDIALAPGLDAAGLRAALAGRKPFVVTDAHLGRLHLPAFLADLGPVAGVHVVPAGEPSKSLAVAETVFGDLIAAGADRGTPLVAFGGGVVGDLAGFVAATWMRGVPFVQVPTSLLAMVDSSVGGKVAVNHPKGKNMIGCFHQPESVWIATSWLATLPRRELAAGLAEVIKYGIQGNAEFFAWLEEHLDRLLALDTEALLHAVEVSVRMKAEVVAADERETTGLRAVLNLGHTFGHAEETLAGYGAVLHGEAVAAGLVAACGVAERLGRMSGADTARVRRLVERAGLPARLRTATDREAFWRAMQGDKKSKGGSVRFVIPETLGRTGRPMEVPRPLVDGVLDGMAG